MVAAFEHLTIRGYRRLLDVSIEMRPLTVTVGANGSGKTSLLEVFSLLSSSAQERLEQKLSDLGGIAGVLTRDRARTLTCRLDMSAERHAPIKYSIEIAPAGQAYQIQAETLTQQNDPTKSPFKHIESYGQRVRYSPREGRGLQAPAWEHNFLESSLAQVPRMYQQPEDFRKTLASTTLYAALDVSPKSPIRLPQSMRPALLPGKNGEDLVSCLYYMRETDQDRFEVIQDMLVAGFPDFERLSFPPVAAGTLAMTWKEKGYSSPFYMHELSEGTLRFLWLATLLQGRVLPSITMIDEPEVSLHPRLIKLLAELMRSASHKTQLIVATHSETLVRSLEPSEVLVADADGGQSRLRWADSLDLDAWLQDYTLDQIWNMNLLEEVV